MLCVCLGAIDVQQRQDLGVEMRKWFVGLYCLSKLETGQFDRKQQCDVIPEVRSD